VQHLVSAAAGDQQLLVTSGSAPARRGLRDRLAKALEGIAGSTPSDDW